MYPGIAAKRSSGFTIIEVMVSVMIFSIGLIGVAPKVACGIELEGLGIARLAQKVRTAEVMVMERPRRTAGRCHIGGVYHIEAACQVHP